MKRSPRRAAAWPAMAVLCGLALTLSSLSSVVPARADWQLIGMVEPSPLPSSWGFDTTTKYAVVGDTVTWLNFGGAPHTATAYDGSFDSPLLQSGESWSFTAATPGTFFYYCKTHPDMRGTLVVSE